MGAVESAVLALPASQRAAVGDLDAVARVLAQQVSSMRSAMLQLADRSLTGLTAELEQVRDIQRRVDAANKVRGLLHAMTPT